jgi:excinuclease ABC subunit A
MADVERLIHALHRLIEAGHTVVVIEHQVDVWAEADWMVDLGPEGGAAGGRVLIAATPKEVAKQDAPTGRALKQLLARQKSPPR